jgi:hypothetical protein
MERQKASGAAPKRQFTGTDYMAALLFVLGQQDSHSDESLGAVLYLLSIAVDSVPYAVRRKKFESFASLLLGVLETKNEDQYITRWALVNCGLLLNVRDQDNTQDQAHLNAMWSQQSSLNLMKALMVFSIDPRAKVRISIKTMKHILNNHQ